MSLDPKANSIIGPAVRDRGAYIERLEQLLNDEQGTGPVNSCVGW
jgi:hypothetical protein